MWSLAPTTTKEWGRWRDRPQTWPVGGLREPGSGAGRNLAAARSAASGGCPPGLALRAVGEAAEGGEHARPPRGVPGGCPPGLALRAVGEAAEGGEHARP